MSGGVGLSRSERGRSWQLVGREAGEAARSPRRRTPHDRERAGAEAVVPRRRHPRRVTSEGRSTLSLGGSALPTPCVLWQSTRADCSCHTRVG